MAIKNLDEFKSTFENKLESFLLNNAGTLKEEMLYACMDGGKRIRPLLVYIGAHAYDGGHFQDDSLFNLAIAIELIHSYSLIHDDLPCMDNADYRRGKLSVQKKYGEATAVLVGDKLLTLASKLLLDTKGFHGKFYDIASTFIFDAANKMVDGQVKDIAVCKSEEEFIDMYRYKTGALLYGAFMAGVSMSNLDEDIIKNSTKFIENYGLAFQYADDLKDHDKNSLYFLVGENREYELLQKALNNCREAILEFDNKDDFDLLINALIK